MVLVCIELRALLCSRSHTQETEEEERSFTVLMNTLCMNASSYKI